MSNGVGRFQSIGTQKSRAFAIVQSTVDSQLEATTMFDVGSLVTISKGVLDTFGSLRRLVEEKSANAATVAAGELTKRIDEFQARLEGIAIQLQQSV
jgi:hypothetical protein